MNVVNGGVHADSGLEIQEFMIVPLGAPTFPEALRAGAEVFHTLKAALKKDDHTTSVGDEGGFAPRLQDERRGASSTWSAPSKARATSRARTSRSRSIARRASSTTRTKKTYTFDKKPISGAELVAIYAALCEKYPLVSIEDGCAEDDWDDVEDADRQARQQGAARRRRSLRHQLEAPPARHRRGRRQLDPREAEPDRHAHARRSTASAWRSGSSYRAVISHRSGETEDSFIADLAVATNAGQIKTGSLSRSDRIAKYNQLLRIGFELGRRRRLRGLDPVHADEARGARPARACKTQVAAIDASPLPSASAPVVESPMPTIQPRARPRPRRRRLPSRAAGTSSASRSQSPCCNAWASNVANQEAVRARDAEERRRALQDAPLCAEAARRRVRERYVHRPLTCRVEARWTGLRPSRRLAIVGPSSASAVLRASVREPRSRRFAGDVDAAAIDAMRRAGSTRSKDSQHAPRIPAGKIRRPDGDGGGGATAVSRRSDRGRGRSELRDGRLGSVHGERNGRERRRAELDHPERRLQVHRRRVRRAGRKHQGRSRRGDPRRLHDAGRAHARDRRRPTRRHEHVRRRHGERRRRRRHVRLGHGGRVRADDRRGRRRRRQLELERSELFEGHRRGHHAERHARKRRPRPRPEARTETAAPETRRRERDRAARAGSRTDRIRRTARAARAATVRPRRHRSSAARGARASARRARAATAAVAARCAAAEEAAATRAAARAREARAARAAVAAARTTREATPRTPRAFRAATAR